MLEMGEALQGQAALGSQGCCGSRCFSGAWLGVTCIRDILVPGDVPLTVPFPELDSKARARGGPTSTQLRALVPLPAVSHLQRSRALCGDLQAAGGSGNGVQIKERSSLRAV